MKQIFVSTLLIAVVGFSVKKNNSDKGIATVNQINGVYIFVDSKPAAQYDYIGSIEIKRSKYGEQYEPVRDAMLKEIKKQFPQADGAILHFVNGARDKADAIKFK